MNSSFDIDKNKSAKLSMLHTWYFPVLQGEHSLKSRLAWTLNWGILEPARLCEYYFFGGNEEIIIVACMNFPSKKQKEAAKEDFR